MTTDLDTGEHTAALVELMGDPQVGERQPRPAAAKKIRGRTLDVDVLTGEGPRLSRLSARGVTPSAPLAHDPLAPFEFVPEPVGLSEKMAHSGTWSKASSLAMKAMTEDWTPPPRLSTVSVWGMLIGPPLLVAAVRGFGPDRYGPLLPHVGADGDPCPDAQALADRPALLRGVGHHGSVLGILVGPRSSIRLVVAFSAFHGAHSQRR